ncbi:flavanone 3-dioxygenase 2 [Physcomitrium patens]|uniref:Fe2OG dioxygenase domain-containing protein n=2 Tax=Physcomitrium patens TaxID=3218 RepID=A0A2K1IAQ6_PHYPA|nr:flavanone 3-dioxygenase 2-like [Physcomitrium patens]XP_024367923.1 flavanone 3-dioxygenase 2-like [Physcomitrium patens]PNR26357.1 hypothetical protein PHYPA_030932 [Physcomitrium patens]|eukprot:XP_024367920.1 flavanone 3-dioxygenase 2-like [Physcomitrella patens]
MAAGAAVTQSEDSGHDKPNAQIQLEKPVDTSPLYTMQAFFDGKMKVEDFARSEQERPSVPHYVFDDTLPVIDIAAIKERSSEEREANVAKMLMAARSWGFFRIINHDVPVELVKQVEANGKQFFALPMERKLSVRAPDFVFGYTGGSPIKWKSKWWLEGLMIKVTDEALDDMVNQVYPHEKEFAAQFKKDLKSFFGPMHELSRFIVEELTEGLGLERDTYTRLETPNSNCTGRMNHYPVCSDPDSVLGIPGHADTQMLAILYQDDVGGLQVLKDGEWVGIRPDDNSFIVNIGDTFQAITNGILHSASHRAVVNSKKDRYSTVYFYGIDNSITLTVPPGLITEDRPLKYRPFTIMEHRKYIVDNEVPLDAVRHLQINPEA